LSRDRRGDQGPDRHRDVAARACAPAADREHRNGRAKGQVMSPSTAPDDPILLVHAYLDGELDPAHPLALERRFASEPALAAERDRIAALRQVIQGRLPREAPPPGLARRIEAAVGIRQASSHPSWRALAASVLVAAFVGGGATWFTLRPGPDSVA